MCGGYDKASLVLYVPRRAFGPGDQIIAAGGGLGSHSSVCGTWAQRPPRRPGWAAAEVAGVDSGGAAAAVSSVTSSAGWRILPNYSKPGERAVGMILNKEHDPRGSVMRSSSRYIRMVIAATAGVALALTSITAASALPGRAGPPVYVRAAAHAQRVPPGRSADLKPGPPIIIHSKPDTSGLVGYAICLYHSQNNCISDTANGVSKRTNGVIKGTDNVILVILSDVGDGITVWAIIKAAHKSYKLVKKYLYKGKHVYTGKGDGLCMGDFHYNEDVTLDSCGDSHGIYWQVTNGKTWNTYAKGDLIASNLKIGTRLFVHKPKDWYTWAERPVCVNGC
jgi:hypothetical protein